MIRTNIQSQVKAINDKESKATFDAIQRTQDKDQLMKYLGDDAYDGGSDDEREF